MTGAAQGTPSGGNGSTVGGPEARTEAFDITDRGRTSWLQKERDRSRMVTITALCFCYAVTLLAAVVIVMVWSRDSVIKECVSSGGSWTGNGECTRVAASGDGAVVVP